MLAIEAAVNRSPDGSVREPESTPDRVARLEDDRNARGLRLRQRMRRSVQSNGLLAFVLLTVGYLGMTAGILNDGALTALLVQFAAAGPLLAALVVLGVGEGRAGVFALGRALIQWRVSPVWMSLPSSGFRS